MSVSTNQNTSASNSGELALSMLRQLPGATLALDRDLRVVLAAGGALAHHGLQADALEGRPIASVIDSERWAIYEPLCRKALQGATETVEVWSADETRCYSLQVGPWSEGNSRILGVVVIAHDITQRKHSDEARRHAQERFELLFEQSPIGMALLTPEGRPVRVNEALLNMTGYSAQQLLSKTLDEITDPEDRQVDQGQLWRLRAGEIDSYHIDKRYLHARGHLISAVLTVSLVRDRQGKPQHLVAQIQDVTERRQVERRLAQLTEHDQLTGLLSRRRMELELATRASEGQAANATLIVIGLDDFRKVNDTYGHRIGDDLLKLIANELRRRLRGGDLIARLGGDEFAILLPDTPPGAAEAVARDLGRMIADSGVQVSGSLVTCSASVGLSAVAGEPEGAGAPLLTAERAMHAAKRP